MTSNYYIFIHRTTAYKFCHTLSLMSKSKKKFKNVSSSGEILDSSMEHMEETRFRKKYQKLTGKLAQKLHFSYLEIECLLLIYYKMQKCSKDSTQGMDKIQFRDFLHCGLDMTEDDLTDRILYALDKGPSPFMAMETWVSSLSLFLRGTREEKINFCFSVYDSLGEGILSKETMTQLMKHSFLGLSCEEDAEETARDLVDVLTKKLDIDRDGKISFNDYRQSVLKSPMLQQAFGECLPSRKDRHTFLSTFVTKISKM